MYSNPRNIWQNQAVGAPRLHPGEEMSMQKKEKRKRKKKEKIAPGLGDSGMELQSIQG